MDLPALRIAGVLALLATSGCAPFERSPAPEVEASAPQEKAGTAKPAEGRPAEAKSAEARQEPVAPAAAPPVVDSTATAPDKASMPDAKVEDLAAKPSATAPETPAPKKEIAAPAKPPAAPPLDLNALEKRLKDTEAIGVFTKLTLKNQVDDLLVQFEAHHGGAKRTSLAELRQPYDLLIIKVLSLLQDRDARLANDLIQSREAIWSILSDPAKFQRLVNENRS